MTLTIHKLSTRCRAPIGVERPGVLVEDVARGPLVSGLNAHLGPSLDRLPAVVRLKQVRVRLKVQARNLNATTLADVWARALTRSLHRALAYPPGDGAVSSRRYETDAAYRAAMMHHIATRGLAPSWEFPELQAWHCSSPSEAALGELLKDRALIGEIAAQLDRQGWLEAILALWDELSLERVMQRAADDDRRFPGLSLDNFVELARVVAGAGLRREWAFAGRRQAIRLWVRLEDRFPLRAVWHGLRLLQRCLEVPALLVPGDSALLADRVPFPPWCEAIVSKAALSGEVANGGIVPPDAGSVSSGLLSVLDRLRSLVLSAARPNSAGRSGASTTWTVSDCAGTLLMLSVVRRLDLWQLIHKPQFVRFGGLRALSFLLAGIGMTLLKRWSLTDPIEPAVALFAGIFSQPDLAGMRQFFSETDVSAVAEFVDAETWTEALEAAATKLSRAFASRVRGFRQASRDAVVKQFIRVRGRVLVEETRVLVVLESIPSAVALRLSGMDDSLEHVEWLGQRRVEFVLEGL